MPMNDTLTQTLPEELRQALYAIGLRTKTSDGDAIRFWGSLEGRERDNIDSVAASFGLGTPTADTAGILRMAEKHGLPAEDTVALATGATLETARETVLSHVAATKAPVRIAVGEDANKSTIDVAITDAMMSRASLQLYSTDPNTGKVAKREQHGRAMTFRGASMVDLCRSWLQGHGVATEGLSRTEVVKLGFDRQGMAAHGTSDFANITLNALNKSLRAKYTEFPQQWPKFCRRATAPDFKNVNRVQLGEVPAMLAVPEGAEYKLVTIGDAKETYALVKFGRSFELTWEAMINDDVDAFTRIPAAMYDAAIRIEDYNAISVLNNGLTTPNMGDGNLLFDATNHTNYTSSGTAVSVTSLNAANALMRAQTGLTSGVYLNLSPAILLCPCGKEGLARSILESVSDPSQTNPAVRNIWGPRPDGTPRLELIVHQLLDANSSTKWYLSASPDVTETIEMLFLEGYEQPTIEQIDSMNPDVRKFAVRHVNAAKAIDWRGLYLNAGA